MQISQQDIEHLALLARLNLSQETKKKFAGQLSRVIDYVEIINNEKPSLEKNENPQAQEPYGFREDKAKKFELKPLENLPPKKEGKYIVSPSLK